MRGKGTGEKREHVPQEEWREEVKVGGGVWHMGLAMLSRGVCAALRNATWFQHGFHMGLKSCQRVSIYIYIYVCMYACMRICIHSLRVHMCICTYVCVYVCISSYMLICISVCMYGCMYTYEYH